LSARAASRWSDLRLRILSACVLAPLGLAGLWLGGTAWLALIAVLAVGLGSEWFLLCRKLVRSQLGWRRLAAVLAGVPYIGLATAALLWLRADDGVGRSAVLFVMLVVWASDIGAYLVGRLLGGPLLAPAISPGKTWSGAAGGLLAAALVGFATLHPAAALLATGLGIAAQLGDLMESAMKRGFGVKDSGWIIPGHGGLLDRLDGLLTAAPAAAAVSLFAGRAAVGWG